MRDMAEHILISLSRKGNGAAASELFQRHYPSSVRIARRILASDAEAEDAVQSSLLAAFRQLHTFREEASFGTWIHRIVVNCCLATFREGWRRHVTSPSGSKAPDGPTLDMFASPSASPEKLAWCGEIATAHKQAVRNLPQHFQVAYLMCVVDGRPIVEVAGTLGLSIAATKSRVYRARQTMRESLRALRPEGRNDAPRQPASHFRLS